MPTGYLVTLGSDNALWFGDLVAATRTTFTTSTQHGAGTVRASGTQDGEAFVDRDIDGVFETGTNGQLYFVPNASGVLLNTAQTVISPGFSTTTGTGTLLSDSITGTTNPQTIDGRSGNDTIYGGAGGEFDRDVLFGGSGNDRLYGQSGWDRLKGGAGNDALFGGAGTDIGDFSDGTAGVNIDVSTKVLDLTNAGLGIDTLDGMDGAIGTNFNDTLIGSDGDGEDPDGSVYTNYLDGGAGDDSIDGRSGSDILFGGTGNDTVIGGIWDGDSGVILETDGRSRPGGTIDDRIYGGAGNDILYGDDTAGTSTQGGNDSIDAGDGNDTVVAGAGNDTVYGGAGNDNLFAGAGADSIFGGVGRDSIEGGAGNDTLSGGADADTLKGGDGADSLLGGAGSDLLDGDTGADTLTGGTGNDTFIAGDGDLLTDFNTTTDPSERDIVDLSGYYNRDNLARWNEANPDQQYGNPLAWLRADQADGRLNMMAGQNGLPSLNMQIKNGATAVAGSGLETSNTYVICFGFDAEILTDAGKIPAGLLRVGDKVMTRDAGAQVIRWVGRRTLQAAELAAEPNLRPIRIAAGALGMGTPDADLIVSPQHRVLVRSKIAQRMFGSAEVLVAAKQLLCMEGIEIDEGCDSVTYVHFLFDDHQVVWANGAEAESLHPGKQALKAMDDKSIREILTLFPELGDIGFERPFARTCASGRLARKLAERHAQNSQILVERPAPPLYAQVGR